MNARRDRLAALAVALVASGGVARAQSPPPSGGDAAAAAAELFQQGREALQERRFDVACARFAESQRLDPKVGTLLNLARCEDGAGKLAKALRYWDQALDLARRTSDARQSYVVEQREVLVPRVPVLSIRGLETLAPDARVRLDDEELAPGDLASAVAVDPGEHVVRVTEAGHADAILGVAVAEGATASLALHAGPLLPASAVDKPPGGAGGNTQRIVAVAMGGVGAIGLGVGAVFGAEAIGAANDHNCSNGVCSTEADARVQRNGITDGNVSTVAFVAGGVLLAGGIVLWLTAPRAASTKAPTTTAWAGIAPASGGLLARVGASW
jgi:hypothetical protein